MNTTPLPVRALVLAAMALPLAAPWQAAQAARPLVTDDARIVDPQSCRLEAWLRFHRDGTERWALPGCNVTGNFELTFGGAVQSYGDGTALTDIQLQGKTVLKPVQANGYGVALVFGGVNHPKAEDRKALGTAYAYVPLTVSFADDHYVLHTNLGISRDREARETRMTWGIATEAVLNQRLTAIAESFGENRGNPWYQLGLRIWLVPNRVQIDATYGSRLGNQAADRFVSVGLRLLSPPFLR
ncbi:hypothetical protein K6V92_04765 [Cupriavidus respiraculi]|uniref:hypothetical protein n=1 Tax=Cupriavidus respiraculi TaxID=195930 RepID=UPI001C96B594|nr:hypothetical protein [Cupriavidus respiraculi]MBY4945933.1 hypothetical protein [Cupriavidus respiraculi]